MVGISIIIALVGVLLLCIVVRTSMIGSKKRSPESTVETTPSLPLVAEHLAKVIQFPTISHKNPKECDWEQFRAQEEWLEETYPLVHRYLRKEHFQEHSLLYTWEPNGGNCPKAATSEGLSHTEPLPTKEELLPSQEEPLPILLMAHLDVVDPGDLSEWKHAPFSGTIEDGVVWGRGALDIKFQIITILETVEHLLSQGFTPNRSVYIAFGHNEEILGEGSASIAAHFREQGCRFALVHDEGGAVTRGVVPLIVGDQATVGLGEKGVAHIDLEATTLGGHAAMPPKQNSLNLIAEAIYRLEKNPPKRRLIPIIEKTFTSSAPAMKFPLRTLMANLWLFKPLLLRALEKTPETNALIRSTITPITVQSGSQDNIIPPHSKVTLNARLLSGDTKESILEHIRKHLPEGVTATLTHGVDPSPISLTDTPEYRTFLKTMGQTFPEATISPYLMLGGTDSRHYADLSDHVLRFSPYIVTKEELRTIHGVDERVSLENIELGLRFYGQLLKNFCKECVE